MGRELPILFNTDMVCAILDGRKTVTRRIVKQSVWENFVCEGGKVIYYLDKKTDSMKSPLYKAPYQVGDILYVRETWAFQDCIECMNQLEDESCMLGKMSTIHEDKDAESEGCYIYRAGHPHPESIVWRPSIHIPKEAARIWLKVTDVRVERLKEITIDGCEEEGCWCGHNGDIFAFMALWDSTIKKSEIAKYGWDANPWVWVINFERCEKPKKTYRKG